MKTHHITIDQSKCIGCGLCAKTCVAHNIEVKEHKAKTVWKDCVMCGQCTAVCPTEAVSISGYDTEPMAKKREERLHPQDVLDVIRFRRSIRKFENKSIAREVVDQVLEAGRLTHTAKNRQDVSFVVLDQEKDKVEQMAVRLFRKIKPFASLISPMVSRHQIDPHFFFFEAPIAIVILAKDKTNGILAAQNMEFVAEANGLGVLFSGFFTMAANASWNIKKAIHMPKGKHAAMTLVLGYPAVKYLRSAPREKVDVRYL